MQKLLERIAAGILLFAVAAGAEMISFKERRRRDLIAHVPAILAAQDRATGRFGTGIWIVTDQNVMLPLAAAWAAPDAANSYYHSRELLDAIMAAGDALIEDQDADGRWVFRKKDGSTWGKIYMPWTYSRWIRAFSLIRDAMPPDRRARWEKALTLGYTGISRELAAGRVHNIPAHHAMGLWFASGVFGREEWKTQARDFLRKVAKTQHPDGYWSENSGPVVNYGAVYVDSLGIYAAASGDKEVLPVLRKAAVFHTYFTYPDGSDVETVDERNYYHGRARLPTAGFTVTPEGRSYLARQLRWFPGRLPADHAAALLLWGREGEGAERDPWSGDFDYVLGSGDAAVRRRGPWHLVISAFTAPVPRSRWMQDRQNFISVFHEGAGLLTGGGNTKLQPFWSTFTSGDTSLLRHRGDENPNFMPRPGLTHVPSAARLLSDGFGLELTYGGARGSVRLEVDGPDRLRYVVAGDPALTAHVVLMRRNEQPAVRMGLPAGARLLYPMLPFNPYAKDGKAPADEARTVVEFPASREPQTLTIQVER